MRLAPLALAATLFATACTQYQQITTAPVTPNLSSAMTTRAISYDRIALRTVQPGPDGKPAELLGARCTLRNADLSAEVTTPAAINLPRVKGQPAPIAVTCRTADKTGAKQMPARLVRAKGSAPAGGGLAGALIMAAAAGAITGIADRWSYAEYGGDVLVELK